MNKIKFTKELKCNWWLIGVFVFCIWVTFPFLFKALMSWMNFVGVEFTTFASFGPIGDIYGSLNTLFTSATLAIVVYSTILQRQANEDARNAMAEQLQQARDATATQLIQAREATEQQIENAKELSRIELKQMQEATQQQLDLAQETHDAQMEESEHAIFSSIFNILINQKDAVLEKCGWGKESFKPNKYFEIIAQDFELLLQGEMKGYDIRDESTEEHINYDLILTMNKLKNHFSFEELTIYFYMLIPLINLIKNSTIKSSDKVIYYSVISNSMTYSEQVTLLWFTSISHDFQELLKNTHLLNAHFDEGFVDFIRNNFDASMFGHPRTLEYWD